MRKVIFYIFVISISLFTILGSILVVGQLLSLLVFQGKWVIGLNENLSNVVYFITSIAAFTGYLLSYFKKKPKGDM